ncbi:MAG: hypothetical protein LBK47_05135 [Prevotellaceae bacterium]|jgi:hypothetical protein|nr:hypothetical protein [Prevotellaceae bacterium]
MKNIARTTFVSGLIFFFISGCSYHLPDSYEAMERGRAKDSIAYLYRYHVTYGTVLFATDTINLFTRAGKQISSSVAIQGDTLTVLNFHTITKKGKEDVWAFVNIYSATKHFTAWLPATKLTTFTTPNRWTRHVLPIPFNKRDFSLNSCAFYLIPFAVLTLFGLIYIIIAWVQKRKYQENSSDMAIYLCIISVIIGIMLFLLLVNGNILHHFYYNPNLLSWGELPLSMILLTVISVIVAIMTIAAIAMSFRRFKWQKAIYHAFGCLSIPVASIILTVAVCSLVLLAILAAILAVLYVVGVCIIILFILGLASATTAGSKRYGDEY